MAAATAAPNPGGYGECGRLAGLLSPEIGIMVKTEIIGEQIMSFFIGLSIPKRATYNVFAGRLRR